MHGLSWEAEEQRDFIVLVEFKTKIELFQGEIATKSAQYNF